MSKKLITILLFIWQSLKHIVWELLIGLDQLLNVIVWIDNDGWGRIDEMLSARAWRLRHTCKLYIWINRLFFWQFNHCQSAYETEMNRKQLPSDYTI